MDLIQLTLAVCTVMIISACVGSRVQKISKFIRPKDFVTIAMVIFCIAGTYLLSLPIYLVLPVFTGYVLGYMLSGRSPPLYLQYIDPATCETKIRYFVVYTHDDVTCIAEQTNKAFLQRLLGIHHKLLSNKPIENNWKVDLNVPKKRKQIVGKAINVDSLEESFEIVQSGKRKRIRKIPVTKINLAYASTATNAEFTHTYNAFDTLRKENEQLISENYSLKEAVPKATAKHLMQYIWPSFADVTLSRIKHIQHDGGNPP